MFRFFGKSRPSPINKLSLRLIALIIGFLALAEILILVPALPRFHQSEMESRMRELTFMAELRLIEEKGSYNATPIPPGCGIGVTAPDGMRIWFGNNETITKAQGIQPKVWNDGFFAQLGFAVQSVFTTNNAPVVYRIDSESLMKAGVHTQLRNHQQLDLIMPADILTNLIRWELAKGVGFVILLSIIIGIPVARFAESRITAPIGRLVDDMTAFADDPYHPRGGQIYASDEGIISDAQRALDNLQQSTRNELVQRDKLAAIGEAVAKVNHDMRNVLASAMLVSDSLEDSDDPKVSKSARIVRKAVERGAQLCTQMLTFIKSPENIRPEKSPITDLINECAEEIGIPIKYSGPEELVVDSQYFFRLIHNIVNNAEKAGATQVNIEIWKAGSYAVMDISDNGPGIPKEMKDKIFKPFTGSTRGSTGLGLCISRDIAIAHGGDLRLTRSNENGSEFRLRLPVEILGEMRPIRFWS